MNKLSFFGLFFLLILSACRTDIDEIRDTITISEPPIIIDQYDPIVDVVSGSLTGIVYDETKTPIVNALIRLGNNTYNTDEDGLFFAEGISMDREGTFFTVEKDGYFKGSRRFFPQEGSSNYAVVELLALNSIGSFEAGTGGQVESSEGIKLSFPSDAVTDGNGTVYSGNVDVAAKWLDPTAPNLPQMMPGNLQGISSQVEEVSLASYGMMAVELFGDNGELLNLIDGKTAQLTFPVPSELAGNAPSEIPLWSFEDEQYGLWVEEGKATLQGGNYVGEVRHFSFWNCDAPYPLVYITGTLLTDNGAPIANAVVKVQVAGSGICAYGHTDDAGNFAGKMPKGEELIIGIGYAGDDCEFETIMVGPFDVDTDLGTLTLVNSGDAFEVSGSVVDCNGDPITSGLVSVSVGNQNTSIYLNGTNTFNMGVLNCDSASDFIITAADLVAFEESDPITLPVGPVVDAGEIAACGNTLSEYFILTVDGESQTFLENTAFLEIPASFEYLFISAGDSINSGTQGAFTMTMTNGAVGTYDATGVDWMYISTIDNPFFSNSLSLSCQGGCPALTSLTINILVNDGPGGLVEGNLQGVADFNDSNGNAVPNISFSADFKIPVQ